MVEIDRVTEFQQRWGGIALPPAPAYEGGPRILDTDTPEGSAAEGWWFSAGDERVSMAYGFMIGPRGEFGIHAERWTPLHASIDGWVESLALAQHAPLWANGLLRLLLGERQFDRFDRHEVTMQDIAAILEAYGKETGLGLGEG
ncbi:hypothetical protein ACIHCQ_41125 [Streptomyces sp. NPDC052236]|uniref:hypothetical protein n=1 Tax=Streptomyces sp. NPDC052236 TaxID=3365686 RepID=UPI0037D75457